MSVVAPFVGAWIEIIICQHFNCNRVVAPFVGAWIEIFGFTFCFSTATVAPFVGAWIEIYSTRTTPKPLPPSLPSWERGLKLKETSILRKEFMSLPSWERGLKSPLPVKMGKLVFRRSLRGSVD